MKQFVLPEMNSATQSAVNSFNQASPLKLFMNTHQEPEEPLELLMHGIVGDHYESLDSGTLASVLNENRGRDVLVRINSPGGSVFDGVAMHTAFLNHDAKVVGRIEGVAASAATFLTTAFDEIEIAKAGTYMIHRAWAMAMGNTQVMTDMAAILSKLDDQIVDMYEERTKRKREELYGWMVGDDDGTYFTAQEALKYGFVDRIMSGSRRTEQEDPSALIAQQRQEVQKTLMKIQIDNRLEQIKLDSSSCHA